MRLASAAIAMLAFASATLAFQDWKGFRFGNVGPTTGALDRPMAIQQSASGEVVVAGGVDDSICCLLNPVGAFYSDPFAGGSAWVGRFDSTGRKLSTSLQWGYLQGLNYPRWFGTTGMNQDGFISVGSIGDTVLFSGKNRVSHGVVVPETLRTLAWREVIQRGGGGGIGIGRWTDSGALQELRLLRFQFNVGQSGGSIGWQIHNSSSNQSTISGSLSADSAGQLWEENDSFTVQKGGSCFVFSLGPSNTEKWLTTKSCYPQQPSEHVVSGDKIWMTSTDTFPGASTVANGNPAYSNWRPGLALVDRPTGRLMGTLWPFGSMQGSMEAIAIHENGSMLVQGEQSSDLVWKGMTISPRLDTARGHYSMTSIKSSYLALLDSNGALQAFQRLKWFANAGAWKLRRVPGKGWVGLSYDSKDILGWSKLYLFDDSLNVLESSDTLPEAMDVELGKDGRILLSGRSRAFDSSLTWLKGTGSMWAATCHLGTNTTGISPMPTRFAEVKIRQVGSDLRIDLPANESAAIELTSSVGQILYHGPATSSIRLALPRGLSICRITTSTFSRTERFFRW